MSFSKSTSVCRAALTWALTCVAGPACAQSLPPLRLDTILISPLAPGLDTISGEEFRREGVRFLYQGLDSIAGLGRNSAGHSGGPVSVRLRGGRGNHTLVLMDGVPVSDVTSPDGAFDFAHLTPNSVKRIEILKGAQSGVFGSQAMGGVINIVSSEAPAGSRAGLAGEYGSFGSYSGQITLSAGNERLGGIMSASHFATSGLSAADSRDGNDERDAYANTQIAASAHMTTPAGLKIRANLRQTWSRSEYDGFPPPDYQLADSTDFSSRDEFFANISLSMPLPSLNGALRASLGYWQIARQNFADSLTPVFLANGQRLHWRQLLDMELTSHQSARFGLDYEYTRSNSDQRPQTSLFFLHEYTPTPQWRLSAGLRFEHSRDYGIAVPLHASVSYAPTRTMQVWSRWGQGFVAPSLYQLNTYFAPASAPNRDLLPERSNSFELGLMLGQDWLSTQWVSFVRTSSDLIVYRDGRYDNIARSKAYGLEASLRFRPCDWLDIRTHYTFTYAYNNNDPALNVSPHRGQVSLKLERGSARARLSALFVGPQPQYNGTAPGWTRLDASASWQSSHGVALYLRIENLLNAKYQDVLGYGTAGISAYGGIRLSLMQN